MSLKNMALHVQIVGWLFIVSSAATLLLGLLSFFVLPAIGFISGDETAVSVLGAIGLIGAFFFVLLAVPGLIAGWGRIRQRPWARILALLLAVFQVFEFPLGTALAVYAFWVLLQDSADAYFTTVAGVQ